ncbi:hypothetical protein [Dechloromonas sp. A34]|uniref:hypothetical protein n=1 Tax=Dechloromonas sp. A34 TaxID=447588 RepID=UPI0022490808|nr:hypothetical protein [Dechloromonas sp. A34]
MAAIKYPVAKLLVIKRGLTKKRAPGAAPQHPTGPLPEIRNSALFTLTAEELT